MINKSNDGKCRYCKEPATSGVLCQKHRDEARRIDAERCRKSAEAGLCRMCKKNAADHGMRSCKPCREREAAGQKKRTAQKAARRTAARISDGVCWKCNNRAATCESKMCRVCDTRQSNPDISDRELCRLTGRCLACDQYSVPNRQHCQTCIQDRKMKRESKILVGLCESCNNVAAAGRRLCECCLENRRKVYRTREAAGLCTKCGKVEASQGNLTCDECTAINRQIDRRRSRRVKDNAFNAYGGYCCRCCGETEEVFLTIDHVAGDGAEQRRRLFGVNAGSKLYLWLKNNNYPEGFQVLCFNCNVAKHRNGVCPHATKRPNYTWTENLLSLC